MARIPVAKYKQIKKKAIHPAIIDDVKLDGATSAKAARNIGVVKREMNDKSKLDMVVKRMVLWTDKEVVKA